LITGDIHFEEEIILILGFEMIANTPTLAAPLAIGVFVHDEFIKKDVHPLMDRNYLCVPIRALASLVGYCPPSWNPIAMGVCFFLSMWTVQLKPFTLT